MSEPNTEVVNAPAAEPTVESEPLDVQLAKSYERNAARASAATESANATTTEPEAQAADPATEANTEETPKDETTAAPEPFTAEQLRDPKFYDRLDKDGWARLEAAHPEVYARVKAAYSAAGKIYEDARKARETEPEKRSDEPTEHEQKLLAAWRKSQSLDEREALEGFREYQRLMMAETLPDFGIDPDEQRAVAIAKKAYGIAVSQMPDLAALPLDELDKVVESNRALMALVRTNDPQNVAIAMQQAGEVLIERRNAANAKAEAERKAAAEKKAAEQKRVNANANNPSNAVAETTSGKTPTGERSIADVFTEKLRERGIAV